MKLAIILLLVLFILATAFFIVVRYYANADEADNWFNENYRFKFAKYPVLRKILNLRWDGDAKADYLLDSKFTGLRIEIDRYDSCEISENAILRVKSEIQWVINKPEGVEVVYSDVIPLFKKGYTSDEIRTLTKKYQSFSASDKTASLYVLCLNEYAEANTNIGSTVHEDGVVIFYSTIRALTNDETTRDVFIASTILHEFGHQLGLEHIDNSLCIMGEQVETPGDAVAAWQFIPRNFCNQEIKQIEDMRSSLSR